MVKNERRICKCELCLLTVQVYSNITGCTDRSGGFELAYSGEVLEGLDPLPVNEGGGSYC